MGILSGQTIATTGTLPAEQSKIQKWVTANGGTYSGKVRKGITHLIASKEEWKKVTDPILEAANCKAHIVSYDWLEDSLLGKRKLAEKKYTFESLKKDKKRKRELKKLGVQADGKRFINGCKMIKELTGSGKPKRLPSTRKPKPSKSFFFGNAVSTPFVSATEDLKRRRAEREAAEAVAKEAKASKRNNTASESDKSPVNTEGDASGCSTAVSASLVSKEAISPSKERSSEDTASSTEPQAKKTSLKDLYHYYLDSKGFEYKITLVRSDFSLNNITRYQLSILESHTTPHTYCTLVQYTPPSGGPTSSPNNTPTTTTTTSLRNPLLNFLKQPTEAIQPNHTTPPPPNESLPHPESIRLKSLITPPLPHPSLPYKSLLAPIPSPFPTAFLAFRHAFRDLTLLTWEERFDAQKTKQKARACALDIEPFVYARPAVGMPVGLVAQEQGLYQVGDARVVVGDAEGGYVRNGFGLPGLEVRLGVGVVGSVVRREDKENKELRVKAEVEEGRGKGKGKKLEMEKGKSGIVRSAGSANAECLGRDKKFFQGKAWGYEE